MLCPKCGAEQEPSTECVRCGLIFSKYKELPGPHLPGSTLTGTVSRKSRETFPWNRILTAVLSTAVLLFGVSWFLKDRFPGNEDLLPELLQEPVQTTVRRAPFSVETGGIVYTIKPLFTYEIHGMVVSHHNCGTWWDIYHHDRWKDFLNIKDLCLVWGKNLETEVYKEMKFSNDSWTCTWFWPNQDVGSRFRETCLSNNHLLCADETLQKRILKTARGDQVYFKGTLSEYSHSGGTFWRGTSTKRSDTGNGACETVFVENYEILKRANPFWRSVHSVSGFTILGCLLLFTARFLRSLVRPGGGSKQA